MELEKRRLTVTRKDAQHKREIIKEMEDAYIKEGDDVLIKGEWVKAKAIYDRSKTNNEVTEYTPSFRKIISDDMNPCLLNIYTNTMEAIVNEYMEKRKRETAIRKREKEKQRKLMKNNSEENVKEKVEVKKPIHSIIKNEVKPIKVEKNSCKTDHNL
jgi:hypothetical protein